MSEKLTSNYWIKGRNTDTDPSKIGIEQYLAAYNLELVGSGKYTSLQNINGTTNVKQIVGSTDIQAPGVFKTKYTIGGTQYNCLTIFTYTDSLFKIWCYNTETTDLYELFEESIGGDYDSDDRVIDAVNYPENGTDILYFTDNYHELRFLKCEIPSPYVANFLTEYDLSLLRKGANGTISFATGTGGTLLSGTYQFAYRSLDPINKRFTKWSTLTNPVHVYQTPTVNTDPALAGVGLVTERKITLTIVPSFDEVTNLLYIQVAVIENVGPTTPTTASLLEITPSSASVTFEYKNNSRIGTISIDDIVVDQAQVMKVKTVSVKQNRLFAGNVEYEDLLFDNGTPTVVSGTVTTQSLGTPKFSSDSNASYYTGYWRNEVYRFGIVYTDHNGNISTVSPLDLSGVTDNQITSGLKDIKFPDRSFNNNYTLFSGAGGVRSLGLTLTVDNHPTWARSFEIVRVLRKKDILFQTPLIPMMTINGTGALDNYPSSSLQLSSDGNNYVGVQNATAQPMTAASMLIPKNMYWPELRTLAKKLVTSGTKELSKRKGEVYVYTDSSSAQDFNYASIFPSPNMYGDTPFVYTGAEKIDYVDYALLKLNNQEFVTPPITAPTSYTGDFIDTSVSGLWYGVTDSQYYFNSGWVAKSISSSLKNLPISDYAYFDNFGEPTALGGNTIMDYTAMQTVGITVGTKPNIQRMGVIRMKDLQSDVTKTSKVFAAGTLNAYNPGGYIVDSSGPKYDTPTRNVYVTGYTSWTNNAYSSAIPIVNVKLGLGDERYGDLNSQHEYISTGVKYSFSDSEVATLESGGSVPITKTIFGGDCFVGSHLFKISDSTYSVMSQNKYYDVPLTNLTNVKKWDIIFDYEGGVSADTIAIPVAVKNSGQYIQVILESEYNGEVRDIDNISPVGTSNGVPIYNNTVEAAIRTPLTYKYNLNLSRQNSQKVFFPELQYSFKQNIFSARVLWTDIKIYNSDQAGFDIIRVGNFIDLEEKRYGITKLAVAGDQMYGIQQQGIVYLPTGENQLEQTDGGSLTVRSSDVIGVPLIVDSSRGSQHLRGIVETGGVIYIPDNINRNVYELSGQSIKSILNDNNTTFRAMFDARIPEKELIGIYDPVRREYWLSSTEQCEVYNEDGIWIGNYEFTGLVGGASCNQKLFLLGTPENLSAYTMYTGAVNQLFGQTVVPRVEFSINPDESFSKTFDNIMISSTERLSSMDFVVQRESTLGNQTGTISLDVPSVEGNFRIKAPRDSAGSRLRGLRTLVTIKWQDTKAALQAVWTKYRLSSRTPF